MVLWGHCLEKASKLRKWEIFFVTWLEIIRNYVPLDNLNTTRYAETKHYTLCWTNKLRLIARLLFAWNITHKDLLPPLAFNIQFSFDYNTKVSLLVGSCSNEVLIKEYWGHMSILLNVKICIFSFNLYFSRPTVE